MVPIAPRTAGRLTAILADEGQVVTKDAVLARLEAGDLEKTLSELQARASLADKEFQRKSALVEKGAVARTAYDQAVSERDAARAAVARLKTDISLLQLTAPEDGTIIRRDGEVGEMIPNNQPVFWLSCCAPLRIEAEVDEEDIPLVTVGKPVVIRADAFPEKIFKGTVQSITPKGDPVSRSYRVRITPEAGTPLMIGMTAETNIIIEERPNALMIPASAYAAERVWVVENGALAARDVKAGARTATTVEITKGLSDSDAVVLENGSDLIAGKKVRTEMRDWQPPGQ